MNQLKNIYYSQNFLFMMNSKKIYLFTISIKDQVTTNLGICGR